MSLYDILDWIWYVFTAFILWPIGVGLRYWNRLSRRERGLIVFLLLILLLEIVATVLRFHSIRNHFIHYFYTLFVLWIGAYFYAPILNLRWLITLIALILAVGIPVEVIGRVGFNHINTVTETLAWLLLAVYAFISLIRLFELPVAISLRHDGGLYYHLGFFIWSVFKAGRACFLSYFIETSLDLYYFADTLVVIIGAISYGLFAIGFMFRK